MAVIVIVHISHFKLFIGLYCLSRLLEELCQRPCPNMVELDDTGWHQMALDGTRWHQMPLDATRCHQMPLDGTRWHQMALYGTVNIFEKAFRSRFAIITKFYYKTFTVMVKPLHAASSQCVPLSSLSCKYQTSVKLKHRESTQAYFGKAQCYSRECCCAR